jgi:multidrug efflux pump subunit AcrA (membrane-fusion protein)
MRKKQNIEIHNEEVREIMQQIPGRLLQWGLTVIFLIFASIIVGSYFFTFNEIVSAPLIITTTNPPAPLFSRMSGGISQWFVSDGEIVQKGDRVAMISSSANLEDILVAESIIKEFELVGSLRTGLSLPSNLILGEIQDSYNQLFFYQKDYQRYLTENSIQQRIELLKQQLLKQEQQYQLSLAEKELIRQQLELAQKDYNVSKKKFDKGELSESGFEISSSKFIKEEREYTSFLSSMKTSEITILNQKRSLIELQEQYENAITKYESNISDAIVIFKDNVKKWRERYLIDSPIMGKVIITNYWGENHIVNSGDHLATIVPIDSVSIICWAVVPASGIGKVKIGQIVNIELTSYPFIEDGILVGKVQSIPRIPEKDGYIVEIAINNGIDSSYEEQLRLIQKMDGTAEIITAKKRLIYRFIKPIKARLN